MATGPLVTRGYGAGGSVPLVVLRGFTPGAAALHETLVTRGYGLDATPTTVALRGFTPGAAAGVPHATLVTRGYGSDGTQALVALRGFGVGVAVPVPSSGYGASRWADIADRVFLLDQADDREKDEIAVIISVLEDIGYL